METTKKNIGIKIEQIPYVFFNKLPVLTIKEEKFATSEVGWKSEKSKLKLKKIANIKKVNPASIWITLFNFIYFPWCKKNSYILLYRKNKK